MKTERIELTFELQNAFRRYWKKGKNGTDLGMSKRSFIACRKGETASVKKEYAERLLENLGLNMELKEHIRKDPHHYYVKNEKTTKLIDFFLGYLREQNLTRSQLSKNIRKEIGESYNDKTLQTNLVERKKISQELFGYILNKMTEVYTLKKVLSVCNAKSLKELAELERIPVTDRLVGQITGFIEKNKWSVNRYAENCGLDPVTIAKVIRKKTGITCVEVLKPLQKAGQDIYYYLHDQYLYDDREIKKQVKKERSKILNEYIDILSDNLEIEPKGGIEMQINNIIREMSQEGVPEDAKDLELTRKNIAQGKKMRAVNYEMLIIPRLYQVSMYQVSKNPASLNAHAELIDLFSNEDYLNRDSEKNHMPELLSVYMQVLCSIRKEDKKRSLKIKNLCKKKL
jgi:hypothetical protein